MSILNIIYLQCYLALGILILGIDKSTCRLNIRRNFAVRFPIRVKSKTGGV